MAITDLAGNPLAPATVGQMLGFVEVSPEEALALDIYNFLIAPIRLADEQEGNLFLRRFLDGKQSVWETTQAKIFALKDLWSVTEIPDNFLPFLKNIVGWTKEEITKRVTDGIDKVTLRRLIAVSVPFWKRRGPEDTIIDILSVITGQRVRIWNWFDFRWVLDETVLDEDHQGRDPWIIELPSEGTDEHRFNVRIVDPDGDTLDRELVQNIVKLMRPVGERIEISYLEFLDQFTVVDDDFQWGNDNGVTVASGQMQLVDNTGMQQAWVVVDGATAWVNYSLYGRLKGDGAANGFGLSFYRTDSLNYYYARLDLAQGRLQLRKAVAGVHTNLVDYFFPSPLPMAAIFYGLRVHIEAEGATNRIKVYVDGDLRIETLDADLSAGSVGVFHNSGTTVVADEIEMFTTPLDTDTVDINAG